MKKVLFVLTLLVFSLPLLAQQHMTFSGIPITGSITQFQAKLQAKGYTLDRATSARFPVGVRAFKGTFAEQKVSLYVYYDQHTKIVYRVKVLFEDLTESFLEQKYERMVNLLSQKYPEAWGEEGKQDGRDTYSFYIEHGRIDIFSGKDEYYLYSPTYTLHIDYWDEINTKKHEANVLDDL